jgi:hypothetical protein
MTRGVIRALDLRPKAAHYHNGRTGTEDEDFSVVEEECEKCVRAHAVILEQLSVLSKPDLGALRLSRKRWMSAENVATASTSLRLNCWQCSGIISSALHPEFWSSLNKNERRVENLSD